MVSEAVRELSRLDRKRILKVSMDSYSAVVIAEMADGNFECDYRKAPIGWQIGRRVISTAELCTEDLTDALELLHQHSIDNDVPIREVVMDKSQIIAVVEGDIGDRYTIEYNSDREVWEEEDRPW